MSSPFVRDASSVEVVERADGSVVIRERPLFSWRLSLAFLVGGLAILAALARIDSHSWVADLLLDVPAGGALSAAATGAGSLAFDFGWSELRVTSEAVHLARRILFFRLREKLPLPVEISAPANGLEITHRVGRYRFAKSLNSIDSTRLVNFLLAKFPVLEREGAA